MDRSRHRDKPERIFRDPVCGMEVSYRSAPAQYDYRDKTWYFCAPSCKEAFVADPEKYLRHHRQHGMNHGDGDS